VTKKVFNVFSPYNILHVIAISWNHSQIGTNLWNELHNWTTLHFMTCWACSWGKDLKILIIINKGCEQPEVLFLHDCLIGSSFCSDSPLTDWMSHFVIELFTSNSELAKSLCLEAIGPSCFASKCIQNSCILKRRETWTWSQAWEMFERKGTNSPSTIDWQWAKRKWVLPSGELSVETGVGVT